mgnify:FL=1
MSERRRTLGLTVPETLVAISLFAVVGTLLVGLLIRTMRISARESVYLELEQSCHFLLQKVERDLTQSGVSGISYLQTPDTSGVAANRIEDVTSEGTLAWSGEQTFYYWLKNERTLWVRRITTSASPLANPRRFTESELTNMTTQHGTSVGENVTEFAVVNRLPDGSSRLVDVSVEVQRQLPNDQPRRFRLEKLVTILN